MRTLLLLPALVSPFLTAVIPGAMEVSRGVYVLVGLPAPEVMAAMKAEKIQYVVCLCRETEQGVDIDAEAQRLSELGIGFSRVVLDKAPTKADFDLFRQLVASLPTHSRILVHCRDGNRAAAVTIAWLAKEGRITRLDAIPLARKAGMIRPETEKALASYLGIAL